MPSKTLSSIVANKIENQIICGKWKVGEQIPPEQELMQLFDVSRITVREAIKTLVSKDILEIRRGCGTFVHVLPGLTEDPLGLRFINDNHVDDYLFEARQVLEPAICRLAALRADEEEIELLGQLTRELDTLNALLGLDDVSSEIIQTVTEKDIAFHTLICRMSKNPIFDRVLPIIVKSIRTSYAIQIPHTPQSTHPLIYEAIKNRDSEEAYRQAIVHLQNSRMRPEKKAAKPKRPKANP